MFANIFNLIIDTIASLYLLIVLLRFALQLARADFYNPISQFVVKATNPLLVPLRKVIPGFGGIDLASLVLASLFQFAVLCLKFLVLSGGLPNPVSLLLLSALMAVGLLLKIYFWSLIVVIIASWVAPGNRHPVLVLMGQIIAPLMRPFQKLLPPMGGFDLSPILVLMSIQVVEIILAHLSSGLVG
jgi:YggT family protein